jgi:predicted P-loop ATPase
MSDKLEMPVERFAEAVTKQLDLTKVELTWYKDIVSRMETILTSKGWSEEQKLVSIAWLVKQAQKTDRED